VDWLRIRHRRERESRNGTVALDEEGARRTGYARGQIQLLPPGGGHGGWQDLRRVEGRFRRAAPLEEVQRRVGEKLVREYRPTKAN